MSAVDDTERFLSEHWKDFEYSGLYGERDCDIDLYNHCIRRYPCCSECECMYCHNNERYYECMDYHYYSIMDDGNIFICETEKIVTKEDFANNWKELV